MQKLVQREDLARKLAELTSPVAEMDEGLLASATYDGDLRLAVLKFYDQKNGRFWLWRDNTGHKPYCYSRLPMDELSEIRSRSDVIQIVETEKLDLLADQKVMVRKIVTRDPLAIGGGNDSIRDKITAWEADIKYYENYAYDRGLKMGTFYRVSKGEVLPLKKEVPERVQRSLVDVSKKEPPEFVPFLKEWAELLGQPLTEFKRVALDIEVANEEGRLPDPETATRQVIAVSFYAEQEKLVYALKGKGETPADTSSLPYSLIFFDDEKELMRAAFDKIMDYPVIVTFNGDNFDLRYLKHRADNLKIEEDEDPIELQRVESSVKHGIHIDLYNFFKNRSIQVYAFSNKYTEHTLNGISEALLGKSKLEFEGEIADLPPVELANYCLKDSQLTYELTTMGGSVAMKLLLVIARIAKMPMNDVGRLGVSNWIRSMLFYEHRRINALIPRTDELSEKGGASSQAIIKGKKYKGGLVIEPKPGVFFDVSVLDFASLYPSLIKVHNLSYETVNCPHEECRSNVVPDTTHWVCRRRKGITSLVTGSLRDLRVGHYKPLTRDPSLSGEDRELYSVVTQGLKVILNAAYGVMGFETFAFYCLPVAEATAALGRDAITRTIQKCTESDINVLYGDSVTGERCVTLRDPDGYVRVMPIEEFFSVAKEFVTRPDGKDEAYPQGWTALSIDPESKLAAFKPVKTIIRHKTSKRIYRVWQKWGSTRVTEDHSLLVDSRGRIELATPGDLAGKHLVRISEIPVSKTLSEIDVYEVLRPYAYDRFYKGRTVTIQAHCDENWVWFGWVKRKKFVRVKRFIRIGSPEFDALVHLLGAYVPEGSSSTPDTTLSKMGASIACSDAEWLSKLRLDYLLLFDGAAATITRSTPGQRHLTYAGRSGSVVTLDYEDKTCKLQMMNGISAVFFKAFCGQKSIGKRLPDFIFNVNREFKLALLANLVKGDGTQKYGPRYSPEYAATNFRYETKSLRLASGLSVLLNQLGSKFTVEYRPRKSIYRLSTNGAYNMRRNDPVVIEEPYNGFVYDLSVDGLHNFVDSCGNIALKNTDSLFLQNITKDQISMVTQWAEGELGVELDLDKSYRYVAFSSRKKNYFGVLPDGTADIRGLTGKKSQTPEFLKKLFYDTLGILSDVKTQPDFEIARSRIKDLLGTTMNRLKNRQIPVAELAFNVMISKPTYKYNDNTPQHVKAAQLLEKSGREIKGGDIISFVKTKAPPYVKPVQLAKAEDVDTEKYVEYAHSMFDQILDALDFSFDEIMGATTLDFFWSP